MNGFKQRVASTMATAGMLSAAANLRQAAAQDFASAGNGGVATASANGGAVSVGDINSGGNAGNAIGVGDTSGGPVAVDGGTVANATVLDVSADGGTAIADASGGDYNLAFIDEEHPVRHHHHNNNHGHHHIERLLEQHGPDEAMVTLSLTDDVFLRSYNWARLQLGIPLPVE